MAKSTQDPTQADNRRYLLGIIKLCQTQQIPLYTDYDQWRAAAKVLFYYFPNDFRDLFKKLASSWEKYTVDSFDIIVDETNQSWPQWKNKKPSLDGLFDDALKIGFKDRVIDILFSQITSAAVSGLILNRHLANYLNYSHDIRNINGIWYRYNGGVYTQEEEHIPYNVIGNLLTELKTTAATDSKIKDILKQWKFISAASVKEIPDTWINLQNGFYDTISDKLIPHSPDRVSFIQLPFSWEKKPGKAERFFKYLNFAQANNPEAIDSIQKFAGYCLTNENQYQMALWLYGKGGAGKSKLAEILSMLVGQQNTTTVRLEKLEDKFETSQLLDKRLVWIDEITIDYFTRATENRLKAMITGGSMTIEMKYGQPFIYQPKAKWIFTANSLPLVNDASEGFWRRFILLPFMHVVSQEDKDPFLAEYIQKNELPAIFNWALEGLKRLRSEGFKEPKISQEAKEIWKEDSEPLRVFIEDYLDVTGNPDDQINNDNLYGLYENWIQKVGYKPMSMNHLSRKIASLLENRNVTRERGKNRRFFAGMKRKGLNGYTPF